MLEIVDTENTYVCECGYDSDTAEAMLVHSCDPHKKQVKEEPLVRLSDVRERIDAHELTMIVGTVINEAADDRLSDDTLWYSDGETLAEAIARTIQEAVTQQGENQ